MVKMAFLTFWNQLELISRKIWLTEKLLNFHTVHNSKVETVFFKMVKIVILPIKISEIIFFLLQAQQ